MYLEATDSAVSAGIGQELIESWEKFESAIVISAGGLSLEIPGPNYSSNITRDANEFYSWRPPSTFESVATSWITSYNNLSDSVRDATTFTLRDRIPFKAVDANPINWQFELPRANVSKNVPRNYRVDATPIGWRFDLPQSKVLVFTDYLPNIRKVASVKPLVRLRNSTNADGAVVQEQVLDESAVEITVVHQAISFEELNQLRAWVKANRTRQIKIQAIDGIEYACVLGGENVPYTENNRRVNATIRLYGNAV